MVYGKFFFLREGFYLYQEKPSVKFRKLISVYCNSAQALSFSPNLIVLSLWLGFLFFRLERERLSEKLRQKEVLERELSRERAALQEQLIKQAKLNEIIRQKDLFEKELRKEKNELQVTWDGSRVVWMNISQFWLGLPWKAVLIWIRSHPVTWLLELIWLRSICGRRSLQVVSPLNSGSGNAGSSFVVRD